MEPELGFAIGSTICPGLSKLIEECGEVLQIAGKLIATGGRPEHWDGPNLIDRITEELADLAAAIAFFSLVNAIDMDKMNQRSFEKFKQFKQWHREQEKGRE